MEGPHPTVSSVKMADALTSYIFNYKFQFKFSLKIENCELKKKKIINAFLVIYIQMCISYAFECEILHSTVSVKVFLVANKIMNMKNFKFCFYFCLKYPLFFTISLYLFNLSFLKIILEGLFMGFYRGK